MTVTLDDIRTARKGVLEAAEAEQRSDFTIADAERYYDLREECYVLALNAIAGAGPDARLAAQIALGCRDEELT